MSAHWHDGVEPNDPALFGKKATKDQERVNIPSKPVPPSPTQLELMRNIVFGFLSHKYLGKRGKYSDKDISGSHTKIVSGFACCKW